MSRESELVGALRQVVGEPETPVPLHEPTFGEREEELVLDCLRTGWVSSAGAYVDEFEKALAEYCGVKRAVAVVNGTAALHACLRLSGVEHDDEVLMPSLTFVATANAADLAGAIPHFVEVERETMGVDPDRLKTYLGQVASPKNGKLYNRETGRKITALVAVHCLGHPARAEELRKVADHFEIPFVEDAAESLGSFRNDRHTGGDGMLSAVSFNGNKIITTGGGGAILTNDPALADEAKHLTSTAKRPHKWEFVHDRRGFNYRMPNINAAIGVGQMAQLPAIVSKKRDLARRYKEAFANTGWLRFVDEPKGCRSNFWLNSIELGSAEEFLHPIQDFLSACHGARFLARPLWTPMHQLEIYSSCPRDHLALTEILAKSVISLPSSPGIGNGRDPANLC